MTVTIPAYKNPQSKHPHVVKDDTLLCYVLSTANIN